MSTRAKIFAFFILLTALPVQGADHGKSSAFPGYSARRAAKEARNHRLELPKGIEDDAPTLRLSLPGTGLESSPLPLQKSSEANLRTHVDYLSANLCKGRGCASGGAMAALRYVENRMIQFGLDVHTDFYGGAAGGSNVVGIHRAGRSSRYVLVLCSYDGLGTLSGNVYPGADANCSGVAAMLELARHHTDFIRTNVVFAAVDGHHQGMTGSKALWNWLGSHGINPYYITMVINLDTMGSSLVPPDGAGKSYLMALGGAPFSRTFRNCNEGLGLSLSYDYYGSQKFTDMFYRRVSDHKPFLDRGIRCVMFTSGITDNTFRRTDTSSTLDYPVFADRVEFIRRWIYLL